MIWLTWRQYRLEMLIIGIVLLLIATVLLVTGLNIAVEAQSSGFTDCMSHPAACLDAQTKLANVFSEIVGSGTFYGICIVLPLILPALAGMFIGGPAIAREFEQGTYRLMWTQGIPWYSWLRAKIALIGIIVLGSFGILFGILSWWSFPIANLLVQSSSIDFSNHFDGWGVVTIAYALFAVMLGIFSGVMTRKTVPAIVLTLVLFVGVRILIVNVARPYYLPPVVVTTSLVVTTSEITNNSFPVGSWILSDGTIDQQGQPVSIEESQVCDHLLPQNSTRAGADAQYNSCILAHGFQSRMVYQPADRYWLFQGIESGIYLLLTAILFALTFWWAKHRIIGA